MDFFFQHGADFNVKDRDGETPLIDAAQRENITVLNWLIRHHVNLNVRDKQGGTALGCAESWQCDTCVIMLKQAGAKR